MITFCYEHDVQLYDVAVWLFKYSLHGTEALRTTNAYGPGVLMPNQVKVYLSHHMVNRAVCIQYTLFLNSEGEWSDGSSASSWSWRSPDALCASHLVHSLHLRLPSRIRCLVQCLVQRGWPTRSCLCGKHLQEPDPGCVTYMIFKCPRICHIIYQIYSSSQYTVLMTFAAFYASYHSSIRSRVGPRICSVHGMQLHTTTDIARWHVWLTMVIVHRRRHRPLAWAVLACRDDIKSTDNHIESYVTYVVSWCRWSCGQEHSQLAF